MFQKPLKKLLISALAISAIISSSAMATVVVINISYNGIEDSLEVNLFDQTTPATVKNFLDYVENGDYTNTVIHRSIKNFVIQGGGFSFEGVLPFIKRPTQPAVINEPKWSNVSGTISMAKLPNLPNSATNQWFFNLTDNSAGLPKLDTENGGYTVFGQITEESMGKIMLINQLTTCSSATINYFKDVPMANFDCSKGGIPGDENFVIVRSIDISNTSETSASELTPVENTLIKVAPVDPIAPIESEKDSGGSFSWLGLFILTISSFARKRK